MAVIRPDLQTGFANAGWKYDRYPDLPSLDANKAMLVADLKGPGIIRCRPWQSGRGPCSVGAPKSAGL